MKLSKWDNFVLTVSGRLPKKTQQRLDEEAKAKRAAEKEIAEALAKQEAAKAAAEKKIAEVKAAAKPQVAKKTATRDGDGDGKINDGTKNEKPAPAKKATPKKQAELKAKPAPASKKKTK